MKAAIRTDASPTIGTGHVMRCLSLADALAAKGAAVSFHCLELPPHLEALIVKAGHAVSRRELPDAGVDWLIVDHYGLDARWEASARSAAKRLMVIDDLADRPHDCDVLLDSAFGEDGARYRGLVPAKCRGLFGSSYVLLRPQFSLARQRGLPRWKPEEPVAHVFFGGADPKALTSRFARALTRLPGLAQEIAVGATYPDAAGLDLLKKEFPGRVAYQKGVADMAAHMSRCTVAVGAPGVAAWERACLGLPAAYLSTHDNQRPILQALEKKGFCRYLGDAGRVSDEAFVAGVEKFLSDERGLAAMRELGLSAIDGEGAGRVAQVLLGAG